MKAHVMNRHELMMMPAQESDLIKTIRILELWLVENSYNFHVFPKSFRGKFVCLFRRTKGSKGTQNMIYFLC